MLEKVKVDKLCFSVSADYDTSKRIDEFVGRYYEKFYTNYYYNMLYCEITPTKQHREGYYGYNHNLQMIPLEKFCQFLKGLRGVAGQDIKVNRMDLAKDILVQNEVVNYLDTLLEHEYLNGYIAKTKETDSVYTVYIAKKKDFSSKGKQKLLIRCYDKAAELIARAEANRVLPLKEPVEMPELPMGYSTGGDRYGLLLYKINLLRCEMELRDNNLPYTTIDQIIEAIENCTFQDTIERQYDAILGRTVFAEPKQAPTCRSLKEIAIELMRKSERNYKTLFVNAGMRAEYNYFKKAKEVTTRENDLNFEELRDKLIREQLSSSFRIEFQPR